MYLLIFSSIFLMVTTYVTRTNYKEDKEKLNFINRTSPSTQLLLFGILIFSFVLLTKNFMEIFDLKWYFSFIICFFTIIFFDTFFGKLYVSLFGAKKNRKIGPTEFDNIKDNNYVVDAVITFTIGALLHLLNNNF